jgi:hypothetical protein
MGRTDRQYADQPEGRGSSPSAPPVRWSVVSTVMTAASSSSVGEPLITEKIG